MPYIGIFTEDHIQRAIDRAATKLGEGKSGLVAHVDNQGEASLSIVKRFGNTVSVEFTGVMDTRQGFKFDKDHLRLQAELIAQWD